MKDEKLEENLENKHESDLTPKEKRLLEKQKLKRLGWAGRLEYIWMYYKPAIFGFVGFLALIYLGRDVYHNMKVNTVLSISVVDTANVYDELLSDEIKDVLGAYGAYDQVDIITNLLTEDGGSFQYQSEMAFAAQLQTGQIDILILPEALYEKYKGQEIFADLREVLGEEAYDAMEGKVDAYHLEVDASVFDGNLELYYEPVCICVTVSAEHPENAAAWLKTLCAEN